MTRLPERRVHRDLDLDTLIRVWMFAEAALKAGDIPEFGSPAWCELPADSPERNYSIARAAMSWWHAMVFGGPVPEEVVRQEINARFADTSKDVANGWAEHVDFHEQAQRARGHRSRPYGGSAA